MTSSWGWPNAAARREKDLARRGRKPGPDADRRGSRAPGEQGLPPARVWLIFLLILLGNFLLMRLIAPGEEERITVPYTVFKNEVRKGNVEAIYNHGQTIDGRFKEPVTWPPPEPTAEGEGEARAREAPRGVAPEREQREPRTSELFTTTIPTFVDPGLEALLIENEVEISAEPIEGEASPWATLLFGFGPALLIIAFYVWLFRRAMRQGGGMAGLMGLGKSRARRYDTEQDRKVTFDDVAGIDEAENELVEIVDFLK